MFSNQVSGRSYPRLLPVPTPLALDRSLANKGNDIEYVEIDDGGWGWLPVRRPKVHVSLLDSNGQVISLAEYRRLDNTLHNTKRNRITDLKRDAMLATTKEKQAEMRRQVKGAAMAQQIPLLRPQQRATAEAVQRGVDPEKARGGVKRELVQNDKRDQVVASSKPPPTSPSAAARKSTTTVASAGPPRGRRETTTLGLGLTALASPLSGRRGRQKTFQEEEPATQIMDSEAAAKKPAGWLLAGLGASLLPPPRPHLVEAENKLFRWWSGQAVKKDAQG